jgi:hypothetical protein
MMRGRIVDHVHPPQPKRAKPSAPARERKDEIEAKLKQVIKEQEQTFLHLVEERRSLVARIEDQSREIQSQVPGKSVLFNHILFFLCFFSVVNSSCLHTNRRGT